MKRFFVLFLLSLFLLVIIIAHCNYEHGIAPLSGNLAVTVYFRGTAPENTEGIYLVVIPVFPPHAINELYHSPNSLPLDKDTVYTQMALPYGHYDAVSLWWYNKETKSNLADVLALPLDATNDLLPLDFDITREDPVFEIELYANWDRVNRDATIKGKIYFNGSFPPNTLATAVGAYIRKPEVDIHYLVWLKSMDFTVGPESDKFNEEENSYEYVLPVRHGSVNYMAVFWLPERAGLTDYRTLGVYEDPPGQPGKLSIKAGETKTGIDIHADWSLATP